ADKEYKRWKRDPAAYDRFTQGDAYVLASTTVGYVIGDCMREYLNAYPADMVTGRPVSAIAVHADGSVNFREMNHIFRDKGAVVCSHGSFKGPNNYITPSKLSSYPNQGYMQVWPTANHAKVIEWGDNLRGKAQLSLAQRGDAYSARSLRDDMGRRQPSSLLMDRAVVDESLIPALAMPHNSEATGSESYDVSLVPAGKWRGRGRGRGVRGRHRHRQTGVPEEVTSAQVLDRTVTKLNEHHTPAAEEESLDPDGNREILTTRELINNGSQVPTLASIPASAGAHYSPYLAPLIMGARGPINKTRPVWEGGPSRQPVEGRADTSDLLHNATHLSELMGLMTVTQAQSQAEPETSVDLAPAPAPLSSASPPPIPQLAVRISKIITTHTLPKPPVDPLATVCEIDRVPRVPVGHHSRLSKVKTLRRERWSTGGIGLDMHGSTSDSYDTSSSDYIPSLPTRVGQDMTTTSDMSDTDT
ncbi:hypothetical protein KIPB_007410, partial [Kipferlia bialata]